MNQIRILIIGAGPTGLVLAICLTRLGIPVRIVDKEMLPGTTSRALVLHARTLEFYEQLGIASKIIEQGLKFSAANLWVHGHKKAHIKLGDIGVGLSPFPYMIIFPQDEHEALLIEELKNMGVQVQRGIECLSFEQNHKLSVKLKHPDGSEEICETLYLAGCDGARSQVRQTSKMDFQGSTYSQYFYVADVQAEGINTNQQLHLSLDEADFLAIFPLKQKNHARLIGVIKEETKEKDHHFTWDDVKHQALGRLDLKIKSIKWFSSYRVHHRLAEGFRDKNVFLLGDAAHIHSPVGGQGMNTGIGDAVNLAWKIAAVIKKEAHETILDSYELERMAFAKRLVATTDRAFTLISSTGPLANFIRLNITPPLLSFLTKFKFVRLLIFKTLSQISINYRMSFLSEGKAGKIHAGDRMPWDEKLKETLPLKWNARLYGEASNQLIEYCRNNSLPLKRLPWRKELSKYGFVKDCLYLIRPDGYIGLVDLQANPNNIQQYYKNK
ncbi:FAD-dependent monooxygenase [Bacteriovorax sp. PP10]|uniref:FAD-dependent monooxygenase n=1 Tax=Bacteriovorax antarcticus TaxID=3088717 RepID=A0ABU5VRX1_9BACT|nr:FAD-dependent monooxygenase [Bacteriovorax sp. PP10]MEA9355337.1 FAD-dependent monooxygenase [Bacteriovorax sp. PP10]